MKHYVLIALLIVSVKFLAGCAGKAENPRHDLWGYIMGLEDDGVEYEDYTYDDYIDGKERVEALKN